MQTSKCTDMQADRQPGRQAGKQTDWQTSRQSDKGSETDEDGNDDDDDDDADDYLSYNHPFVGFMQPNIYTNPCSRTYIHPFRIIKLSRTPFS